MKFTNKEIEVLQGQAITNTIMSLWEHDFSYNMTKDELQDLVSKLSEMGFK